MPGRTQRRWRPPLSKTSHASRNGENRSTATRRRASPGVERIEAGDAGPRDVADVAGHQDQFVRDRRGGHQDIDRGTAPRGGQLPPLFGHAPINRKNAVRVFACKTMEPTLERRRLRRVLCANPVDAAPQLTDCEHAQMDFDVVDGFEPRANIGIRARAFPQLRHDVRVEQQAHRRTLRAFARGLAKSASSPPSGISVRRDLRDVPRRILESASRRISRCSASVDRPLLAARSRSACTTESSRLRTINWATVWTPRLLLSMIAFPRAFEGVL